MAKDEYVVSSPECVSIPVSDVDALLGCDNDVCMRMYLYLKRGDKPRDDLRISQDLRLPLTAVQEAGKQLKRMGLLSDRPAPAAPAEELPQYDASYIVERTREDPRFRDLVQEAGQILGRKLSTTELQKLFGLYDELGLPPEVIVLMMNACKEEWAEKYGPGRVPTMRQIEKEGYAWSRRGIDSQRAAAEYLRNYSEQQGFIPTYMRTLQLGDRLPSASEEKYLVQWLEWGFPPESVALAYDKTVLKLHEFKWNYCNGILKRWHESGLHALDEIEKKDSRPRQSPQTADASGVDWMREYIQDRKNGD